MSLYLWLNVLSISVPFIFSFHPKIRFDKHYRTFWPAAIISAITYLSWDVLFTMNGYWGFNETYLQGWYWLGLPLEEWLFFICIPYASIFTHFTLSKLYPEIRLDPGWVNLITFALIILLLAVSLTHLDKAYTATNGLLMVVILGITWRLRPHVLEQFFLTFLVVLIPFFIVNGILTGSFIENEVVWYNNEENLAIRMFTIPVEDTFYAMGMLLLTVLLMSLFDRKSSSADL